MQFVDQVKTALREDGAESYESIICSIENDFAKQSEIRPDTVRLNQFCGTQKLSELTTGPFTSIKDPDEDRTCNVWSTDLETSSIEDDEDGREMVTCSFYRDSVQVNSDINFLKNNVVHFYAGFNIFEDSLSEYVLS